jgi:outer membrane protein assembly factor BamB
MRLLLAASLISRLRLGAAAILCFAGLSVAAAQPLQFGFRRPASVQLSAPRVDVISGSTATRLEQARALAKGRNWDDAVDILRELAAERSDKVVDLGDGRYVSLQVACHLELARLPAEGLAAYRRRVDPIAERWFREGISGRAETMLRRVVDELFCSSWGDDALMALGELALERGDIAAARRYWEQVSPLTRDPDGQPMRVALRDIDLAEHWRQVERRWLERPRPPTWLAYPDTQFPLADVRARLILTSIRAGELKRAAFELEAFRRFHPDSIGRLGGQDGPYVAALERLVASAGEWPTHSSDGEWATFAGSPTRSPSARKLGPITGPAWAQPIPLMPANIARGQLPVENVAPGLTLDGTAEAEGREAIRPLDCFPVVVNGVVLYADAGKICAADLMTGAPAVTANGVLHRDEPVERPTANAISPFDLGWRGVQVGSYGIPHHTLSVIDGVVYGRVGHPATSRNDSRQSQASDRLVGLDLSRDGALTFRVRPPDGSWAFDGVPVGDDRRLFVAMRKSDATPHAYVACFDAATGNELWRTSIGAADTPAAGYGDDFTHNLLTLVGDRIYFNSNLGLVATLDTESGAICWIRRYGRIGGEAIIRGRPGPLHFGRDPAPCLYHEGLIIVAPSDTPKIFALDADTGTTIWSTDMLPDALHLIGMVRDDLIVSGNRLAALDVRSGELRWVWPESEHAGIRGMGRGVLAGDEVFWPTRHEIYVIHGVTGARSRAPIPLGAISDCGANLAAASGRLIVAGYDKLMAFGAALPIPPNQNKSKTEPVAKAG